MSEGKLFRGVAAHPDGGYVAAIGHNGRRVYLGWFRCPDDAAQARRDAEVRLFGRVFDRREPVQSGDVWLIPLHGQRGVFYGYAMVDLDDFEIVSQVAWTVDPRGYVAGKPSGFSNSVTMHRFLMTGGKKGGRSVDHINGDKMDNRRANLRFCSQAENARNTRISKNNSSGAKGVRQMKSGSWRAQIWFNRKGITLGTFKTKEEAIAAYDTAAVRLHGEFASPNSKQYAQVPGVQVRITEYQKESA